MTIQCWKYHMMMTCILVCTMECHTLLLLHLWCVCTWIVWGRPCMLLLGGHTHIYLSCRVLGQKHIYLGHLITIQCWKYPMMMTCILVCTMECHTLLLHLWCVCTWIVWWRPYACFYWMDTHIYSSLVGFWAKNRSTLGIWWPSNAVNIPWWWLAYWCAPWSATHFYYTCDVCVHELFGEDHMHAFTGWTHTYIALL